jgi:5-methylcytosine-specific restriction endonuclease McrA
MPRTVGFRFTHCHRGHKYTKSNTKTTTRGTQECLTCARRKRKERREEILENKRQWYHRNAKSINAKRKELAKLPENKKKAKKYAAANYRKNKKKIIARVYKWVNANPAKVREFKRKWVQDHPDYTRAQNSRRRTRITKAGGKFTAKEFRTLCEKHNNRCLCCKNYRKLTADHVMPVSKGGSSNIENIQPLCMPCNTKKGTKYTDYR